MGNSVLKLWRLVLLSLVSALVARPSVAHGDESTQGAVQELDEIIIARRMVARSDRLPFSITVINQDDIQLARPLLGLDESLQGVPGLLLQNRYNYAQDLRISLRGFGARAAFGIRGVRIVVDGIPETLPDGQGGVDGIDLGAARQIEVLRGGASAIYGNAGGGVILIESELGSAEPAVSFGVAGGSDGYQRWHAKLGGESGRLAYLVHVSDLDIDGYREHSEASNRQYTMRLLFAADGDSDWLLSAHHTDQPLANDPGGVDRVQYEQDPRAARAANVSFNAGEALQQTRIGLRYRRAFGDNGELTVRQYGLDRDFAGLLPFGNGGAIDLQRRYVGSGVQYRHQFDLGGRSLKLQLGADVDRQRDDRGRFFNNNGVRGVSVLQQRERVTSRGWYLQGEFDLSNGVAVTAGARYDALTFDVDDRFLVNGDDSGRRRFSEFSPILGVHWQWRDNVAVFANLSRSFESPTTTELANPSGAGGFNPDIASQRATHREIGLRATMADRHDISAAVFDLDIRNELIPFELAAFPGRDFFANAGASDRRGLELSLTQRWTSVWRTDMAYTWSDFKFSRFRNDDGDVFDGNIVPGTARHMAHLGVRHERPNGFFAAAELNYVDDIALNNDNTAFNDAYTLLVLRSGMTLDAGRWRFSPYVNISNALDVDYAANTRSNAFGGRYFEAGPGRSVYLGMTVTLRRKP